MKAKCQINTVEQIPIAYRSRFCGDITSWQLPLIRGEIYTIQAIKFWSKKIWYYVEDGDYRFHGYPMRYPALCFELVDDNVSNNWCFCKEKLHGDVEGYVLSFSQWVHQFDFYERLVSGEHNAISTYLKYRS